MVLLSPMSSKSHFCVLLMPIAFCTAHWLLHGRSRALATFGILVFLVSTCTMKGLVGRETGGWLLAHGAVTWATVLTLLATCHVLSFARPSNDP